MTCFYFMLLFFFAILALVYYTNKTHSFFKQNLSCKLKN